MTEGVRHGFQSYGHQWAEASARPSCWRGEWHVCLLWTCVDCGLEASDCTFRDSVRFHGLWEDCDGRAVRMVLTC